MKEILLTRGLVAKLDDDDYERLYKFSWRASGGSTADHPYAEGFVNGRMLRMHRAVMNVGAGIFIDHVNGDTLDNRKENLRISSPVLNPMNKRKQRSHGGKKTTSKYKGVSHSIVAHIRTEGKLRYLGSFETEEEAARAYDAAARELFGPIAALNFPRDGEQSAIR